MIATGAVVMLLVMAVLGLWLSLSLANILSEDFDASLDTELSAVIAAVEPDPQGRPMVSATTISNAFRLPLSGHYWQVEHNGRIFLRSQSLGPNAVLPVLASEKGIEKRLDPIFIKEFGQNAQMASQTVRRIPKIDGPLTVRTALSTAILDRQVERYSVRAIFFLLVALIVTIGFLGAALYWSMAPLAHARTQVQAIRSHQIRRFQRSTVLELDLLVTELNGLLEERETRVAQAETQAGDLAHSLKTSLTVLSISAQTNDPDLAKMVANKVNLMSRIIDHHLARAGADGRAALNDRYTVLYNETQDLLELHRKMHPETDYKLRFPNEKLPDASCDPQDFHTIVDNLLDNARKYGDGRVIVNFMTLEQDVVIAVSNSGASLDQNAISRLFRRGERLDQRQTGSGLGLAICRDLVEIYGGTIDALPSVEMNGLQVLVRLPVFTSGEKI